MLTKNIKNPQCNTLHLLQCSAVLKDSLVGFGYDKRVNLQTDDMGHVGAAILARVARVVGLQTNDVRRNWKGL